MVASPIDRLVKHHSVRHENNSGKLCIWLSYMSFPIADQRSLHAETGSFDGILFHELDRFVGAKSAALRLRRSHCAQSIVGGAQIGFSAGCQDCSAAQRGSEFKPK